MKAVRKSSALKDIRPQRAALYLRVSTGRQAENDVSLPSQRDLTTRHCEREGWNVVDELSSLEQPAPMIADPLSRR